MGRNKGEKCNTASPEQFCQFMSLPLHLIEKVMELSDLRAMLNLAESSKTLHEIMTQSHRLMSRLRLSLDFTRENIENVNKLSVILANATQGRRYERIKLAHLHDAIRASRKTSPTSETTFFFKTLRLIARNVHEVEITNTNITAREFQKVIECCGELQSLQLSSVQLEDLPTHFINQEFLPNFQSLALRETSSTFMYFFQDFCQLRNFKFALSNREQDDFKFGAERFEDFVHQQRNLSSLSIGKMHHNRLRLDPFMMKSRHIESLSINRFFLESTCAANFFRQQQHLRSVKLYDFYDDARNFMETTSDYCQILRIIFSLPRLTFVGVFHQTIRTEDFIFLHDLRNRAVKHLEYDMWTNILEKFLDIFPALEKISLRSRTLRVRDLACEQLLKITASGNYVIEEFAYQPPKMTHSEWEFESILKLFIMRNKSIRHLTLGHENWIDYNFSLSTDFWIEVLFHLPNLTELIVYNPKDVRQLLMLINLTNHSFHSVTIYTSPDGKALTNKFELQDCVKICVVDHYSRVIMKELSNVDE